MYGFRITSRVGVALIAVGVAYAQLPTARLDAIFPLGAKAGSEVELTVQGGELTGPASLAFGHPGIAAEYLDGARFKVRVAADVPPGIYQLRFSGIYGTSSPRWFTVSDQDEANIAAEANDPTKATILAVGMIYNGKIEAGKAHYLKVPVKAGQRYFVDCAAERLGSRLDAVLVALDSSGIELARSREAVSGDPLVELAPAADGEVSLRVSDFQARGGEQFGYRLQVRNAPQIDYLLPQSALPGTKQKFFVYGRNLPGGSPSADGLERIEVEVDVPSEGQARGDAPVKPAAAGIRGFHYSIAGSNRVFIAHGQAPPVVDAGGNAAPADAQPLVVPSEVGGRFEPGSHEWYEFQATKDKSYVLEVFSQRSGAPSDAVLVAKKVTVDAEGKESTADLGNADDEAANIGGRRYRTDHRDPVYRFTADADFKVRVSLEDRFATNSPYRLVVREARPDFQLLASLPMPQQADNNKGKRAARGGLGLRRREVMQIDVLALRRDGFDGEIALTLEGLPAGFDSPPALIAKGQTRAGIAVRVAADAAAWSGELRVSGKAVLAGAEVVRPAETATLQWTVNDADQERVIARVSPGALGISSLPESAPLLGAPTEEKVWETALGGKLAIPIKLEKHAEMRDKIIVRVVDLRGVGKKPPQLEIPKDKDEGTLSIEFMNNRDENKFTAGTHQFVLQTSAKIGYRRHVAEAETAVAEREAANKALEEKKTARDAAKAELDAARAATAETEEQKQQRITAAEVKLKAAEEILKTSEAAQKQATAKAKAAEDRAKPADVQYANYTLPITVKLESAPLRLKLPAEPAKGAKGAKIELPVQLERLYGFADAVTLQIKLPDGTKGVAVPNVTVAKDAGEGKLVIDLSADAAAGELNIEVLAKMKFNGIDVERRESIKLLITES